jgi:hypothetical protein
VRLKYLSPEEGMAVNVSYGDSLLHSEVVKGTYLTLTFTRGRCARSIKREPNKAFSVSVSTPRTTPADAAQRKKIENSIHASLLSMETGVFE